MYSIGEFSKIGSISTKTLRYYDEIGLLHPAYVDEDNHYRYYNDEQVDEIIAIAELKALDLRLEQIKAVMESGNKSLLEHFLKERIDQISNRIQSDMLLRKSIERKMLEIQLGESKMENKKNLVVEAKEFEQTYVMSKKATIEIDQIGFMIGKVFEEIFANNLQPAGPVMTFYLDDEFNLTHANVEVCVPVAGSNSLDKIKDVKLINPGMCATCTYTGVYSKIGKAYATVLKWIEENGYHEAGSPFDCYMNSPQDVKNPEELITQVWFPIKKK